MISILGGKILSDLTSKYKLTTEEAAELIINAANRLKIVYNLNEYVQSNFQEYIKNPNLINAIKVVDENDKAVITFKNELDKQSFFTKIKNKTIKIPRKNVQYRGDNVVVFYK